MREKEISSMQMRNDREKDFHLKKINNLQNEIEDNKKTQEQQLISVKNTHAIEVETKKMEIDSLRRLVWAYVQSQITKPLATKLL